MQELAVAVGSALHADIAMVGFARCGLGASLPRVRVATRPAARFHHALAEAP